VYKVGDKVVHPYHGAGVIAAVERSDLLDEFNQYYIIELAVQQMRLMVPVRTAQDIGLRMVSAPDSWPGILGILDGSAESLPDDFKLRQSQIHERLREGTAESLARIVRDMAWRGRDRTYSPTEQRLYDQARTMLGSELALAQDTGVEQALALIDGFVQAPGDSHRPAAPPAAPPGGG
jgi:CarD family transcriptional regulator